MIALNGGDSTNEKVRTWSCYAGHCNQVCIVSIQNPPVKLEFTGELIAGFYPDGPRPIATILQPVMYDDAVFARET